MASRNTHRSIRRVFDKNLQGLMIDDVTVKREVGLYCGVEEKVSIVGQENLVERNYSF